MKTVIRIEHRCGEGLWCAEDLDGRNYCDRFTFYWNLVKKHNKFPTPDEEGMLIKREERCSFKSMVQLRKWIEPNWFTEIFVQGFNISRIKVSECREGNPQKLFDPTNALSNK